MKKLIFTFAITLLSVSFGYSQTYTNLGGHLNVKDNIWTLDWLNNNYKILEDHAVLVFESKSEVEEFYNDIGDVPSFLVVDWEATWDQSLSYDFDFVDGYVFSSSF